MSRSRGPDERPQRPSPGAPLHLRSIGFSEASTAHRHLDASAHERKRETKVVELETKLSKAQAELKKLKDRLALADAAKVETEKALARAKKRLPATAVDAKGTEETPPLTPNSRSGDVRQNDKEDSVTSPATMDVFEVVVPAEPIPVEDEVDGEQGKEEKVVMEREEVETKAMIKKTERHVGKEASASAAEKEEEEKEVHILKAKLLEKEKEVAVRLEENMIFKIRVEEEAKKLAESARAKQEQLTAQLNSMEEELKQNKTKEQQLNSQLEASEGEKTALEMELKRTKVQKDQWRKAAEAAAELLATGNEASAETGDRKLVERCRSMDKHHLGVSYGSWESPLIAGAMEENGNGGGGTRKSAGARLFGNLWKKNQQK